MALPKQTPAEAQAAHDRSRAYKSRNKRPCDFCRYKKAACHLDADPPCELCIRYGKDCTFVESPAKRRRPNEDRPTETLLPPSSTFDLSNELLSWEQSMPPFLAPLHSDFSFEAPAYEPLMFEQFDPVQAGLALPQNDTPQSLPMMETFSAGEPSLDAQTSSHAQVIGLSGEQDPYLLRHYRFDGNNEFTFQQIRMRRVGENDHVPVHFMIQPNRLASKAQPPEDPSTADTWRREVKEMVSDEVGRRLIQLYVLAPYSCLDSRPRTDSDHDFWLKDSFAMSNHTSRYFPKSVVHVMANTILNASPRHSWPQSTVMLYHSVSLMISCVSKCIHHLPPMHCLRWPGRPVSRNFILHH